MAQLSLALSRPELGSPGTAHTPSLLSACRGAQHSFHHGIHRCRLGQERQVGGRMPPQHQAPRCVHTGPQAGEFIFLVGFVVC